MTRKHIFSVHNSTHVYTKIITRKQVIDCLDHLVYSPLISISILKTTLQHFISAFFIISRRRESTISCSSTADCSQFLLVRLEPLEQRLSSLPLRVPLFWVLNVDIITQCSSLCVWLVVFDTPHVHLGCYNATVALLLTSELSHFVCLPPSLGLSVR